MVLSRGLKALYPCPVCLVPSSLQSRPELTFARRDAGAVQAIVWDKGLNATQKETLLKSIGMRDVEVRMRISSLAQKVSHSALFMVPR